jgi:hypothetical protein
MGDTLNPHTLTAFVEELGELQKEAISVPGILAAGKSVFSRMPFMKNPRQAAALAHIGQQSKKLFAPNWARELLGHPAEIGPRLLHPIAGAKEGFGLMSPVKQIARKAQEMGFSHPSEALAEIGKIGPGYAGKYKDLFEQHLQRHQGDVAKATTTAATQARKELMGSGMTGARHSAMLDPNVSLREAWRTGGAQGLAEQLSRSGWTGETKYTKYLPVGTKSWIPGLAATEIPGIVNAPPPKKTGEGSTLEKGLGALGSTAGLVLTGGLGIIPGTIGWSLSQKAGRRAGRVLDRLRAGSSMDQAINAPSPTEAAQQLSRIEQTYG